MRKILLVLLLAYSFNLQAQQFSRVKVNLDPTHSLDQLAALGLEVDHGRLQPNRYFIGEWAAEEIALAVNAGFVVETLVPDLYAHYKELNNNAVGATAEKVLPPCPEAQPTQFATPINYHPGTMGGYFKYQEMLDMLDQMAAQYPNLIKAREPITTAYSTHENRPVFWLKISDNPNEDEPEPEVFYNALHHAREPNSLSQLIFYMWYLLENYDTDPEIKYLVDNTEMYFVPCINPDGYIYNETTNPDGGGMWRKNRRDNGDGTFGVDLNRNYGYQWGFDDTGSSPISNTATYRGPGPFSEPETQMIREFCLAHDFQIALNYHTFGNLLIYPWGWVDGPTSDHATFSTIGPFMARDNDFLTGFGSQTVGYTTNGGSDDWMYGEQSAKEKIYSMTPEVGPAEWGFWPAATEIDALNQACMTQNLTTAHLVLNFGLLTPGGERYITQKNGNVLYSLKKMGLAPGLLTVSLEPVSDNITNVGNAVNYGMLHLEEASGGIAYLLDADIVDGEAVVFNLVLDNGLYQWRQPVELIYSSLVETALLDEAIGTSNWETNDWALTDEQFHSAPTSFTDSPDSDYASEVINEIILANPITVKDVTSITLSFWAKWDIEEDEDFVQVVGAVNSNTFIPLCGKYSEAGTDQQAFNSPLYDGLQQNWVREEIDLTEWLAFGDSLSFRFGFQLVSDEFIEKDGFYFDDVELNILKKDMAAATIDLKPGDFRLSSRPNPASDYVIINLSGEAPMGSRLQLCVFNSLGQMVEKRTVAGQIFKIDTGGWQPGLYHYQLLANGQTMSTSRFVLSR